MAFPAIRPFLFPLTVAPKKKALPGEPGRASIDKFLDI